MMSKKIHLLIFATLALSGLYVIVLCILSYGLSGKVKILPEKIETIMKAVVIVSTETKSIPLRDSIVHFSMTLLGTPYEEAACSADGFDCSGFIYYVFQHFKIQIPRSSSEFKNFGKEIPIDSVRKGDILVFLSPTKNVIGHVGMVTNPKGMASDFIHASSGGEIKVMISSLKQEGYTRRFVKAVNVL